MNVSDKQQIINTIRLITFQCKSKDVFSCEFGNEFTERVEKLLNETIFDESIMPTDPIGGGMVDINKIGGHSANPWRYEFEECGGYDCMSDAFVVFAEDGNTVTTIDIKDYGDNFRHVAKDNADLISRAPDILSELRRLRETVKQYISHSENNELSSSDTAQQYLNELKELVGYKL